MHLAWTKSFRHYSACMLDHSSRLNVGGFYVMDPIFIQSQKCILKVDFEPSEETRKLNVNSCILWGFLISGLLASQTVSKFCHLTSSFPSDKKKLSQGLFAVQEPPYSITNCRNTSVTVHNETSFTLPLPDMAATKA